MHVKRQCPVCRQPVRKFVRLFFGHSVPEANIGASQANTSTLQASISAPQPNLSNQSYSGDAKDRTEIPDEQDEQPNSVVVDLISSDPMEDETNEASREIDDGEDVEYPNLSHLQYSDIEPDLNEIVRALSQLTAMPRVCVGTAGR